MKKVILMIGAVMIFATGCGLPTYAVKSAMSKNVNVCSKIYPNKTTIFEIEGDILKDEPVGVKMVGDSEVRTYKSGYFIAKVTYKGNIVSDYDCSKE